MDELHKFVARVQIETLAKMPTDPRSTVGPLGSLYVLARSLDDALKQIAAFTPFVPDYKSSRGVSFFMKHSIAPYVPEVHGKFPNMSQHSSCEDLELDDALRRAAMVFVSDAENRTPC